MPCSSIYRTNTQAAGVREMDGAKHSFLRYVRKPLTALNGFVLMDRCVVNDNDFSGVPQTKLDQAVRQHVSEAVNVTRLRDKCTDNRYTHVFGSEHTCKTTHTYSQQATCTAEHTHRTGSLKTD